MVAQSAQVAKKAKPDRRRAVRAKVPTIKLRSDGEVYTVVDWSWAGCLVTGYRGELRPGSSTIVELLLFVDQELEGLPALAQVVRFEPQNNNALALHFTRLKPQDFLSYCDSVGEFIAARVDEASA